MSKAPIENVKTIAAIYVNESDGVLMVKPISEDNQQTATLMLQSMDDSRAIKVDAEGGISVKKIVDLLSALQEGD